MKTLYLFGNWKMYLDYDESLVLAEGVGESSKNIPEKLRLAVFPSSLSWQAVSKSLEEEKISLGAQTIAWVDKGAYTGEISAGMYRKIGAEYALIGHSERRHIFHETNHETRQKLEAALDAGLTPVVCVGETLDERRSEKTDAVLDLQLSSAFDGLTVAPDKTLIVAYEPVWAINTGETCQPAEAERVHGRIRERLAGLLPGVTVVILYGGSVRPENVVELCSSPLIDGVLVGGASVKMESWNALVRALSAVVG